MATEQKPWAYVAFKGTKWGGVCAAEPERASVADFLNEMAASGYSIKPVYDRAEYEAEVAKLS